MWSVTRFALLEKGQSNHTFWGYACMKYCFLSCVISFLYRWICLLMRFIIGLCMSSHLYVVFCRWHKKLAELPLNPVLHKSMSFHKVLYLQWASSFACMYTIWRAPAAIPSTELNEHWPPTAALMRECPQMESACSKNDNVDLLCKWSYLKLQLLFFFTLVRYSLADHFLIPDRQRYSECLKSIFHDFFKKIFIVYTLVWFKQHMSCNIYIR